MVPPPPGRFSINERLPNLTRNLIKHDARNRVVGIARREGADHPNRPRGPILGTGGCCFGEEDDPRDDAQSTQCRHSSLPGLWELSSASEGKRFNSWQYSKPLPQRCNVLGFHSTNVTDTRAL